MRLLAYGCSLLLLSFAARLPAQSALAPAANERPLPDIPTLMHEVEAHQRAAEAIEKDYTYREDSLFNERNSDGGIKKTQERAFDIFWLNGVRLARTIRKDGRDLSPEELKKEDDRLDKEVTKAKERRAKAEAKGNETNSDGRDEISVSRILELGTFSDARREAVNGRPTIRVDFKGNPDAKSHNAGEAAFKLVSGTIWVDEQDRVLQHVEGHFDENYKIGAGLVASVRRGTSFRMTTVHVNEEVWLPGRLEFQGEARYLLFFSFNGDGYVQASDYRKFKASSKIVGYGPVTGSQTPEATPAPDAAPAAQSPPSTPPQ